MADSNQMAGVAPTLTMPGAQAKFGPQSNKEIMADARSSLRRNWGLSILGYILYAVLLNSFFLFIVAAALFAALATGYYQQSPEQTMAAISGGGQLIALLFTGPCIVGFSALFLGIAQQDKASLEDLFTGFRRFGASLGAYLLYSIFVWLWSLLFIIPGIIAVYRYAMAFFVIADDETSGPLEALSRSKQMMKGNKWKLFCLQWRFFWWWILATFFTFGIGYLWLIPYMQTSLAKFYEEVS